MIHLPSLITNNESKKDENDTPALSDESLKNYFKAFPSEEDLNRVFGAAFVHNKPMSGVGGDGFWLFREDETIFLVVFDCMGHGRLASMMTRIYLNAINKAILDQNTDDPSEIIGVIHADIEKQFRGKEKKLVGTGADIGVLKLDGVNDRIEYAGAKMDLVKVFEGKAEKIKANKMPIGENFEFNRSYETLLIDLPTGKSRFYLYSDGVTDLFGGPKDKKFKFANLKKLLEDIDQEEISKAKQLAIDRLNGWSGKNEPLDDALLIGLELSKS